jgi:hypothetical protein
MRPFRRVMAKGMQSGPYASELCLPFGLHATDHQLNPIRHRLLE